MPALYYISDLHLEDKNILKYRDRFSTVDEHDGLIMENWRRTVRQDDVVWVLGDIARKPEGLGKIGSLPGRKRLVRGNHDDAFTAHELLEVFEEIHGLHKANHFWLSHAPIHPTELRGRINIHGHVHNRGEIEDERYFNVCAEMVDYTPISIDTIRRETTGITQWY